MRIGIGCVVVFLAACGGGDSAVDKCDDLVDVTCDRVVECVGGGTHQQCVDEVNQQLPCGMAKSVTASYSRCLMQLRTTNCATLFPGGQLELPADCNGVILTSRLDSEDIVVGPITDAVSVLGEE